MQAKPLLILYVLIYALAHMVWYVYRSKEEKNYINMDIRYTYIPSFCSMCDPLVDSWLIWAFPYLCLCSWTTNQMQTTCIYGIIICTNIRILSNIYILDGCGKYEYFSPIFWWKLSYKIGQIYLVLTNQISKNLHIFVIFWYFFWIFIKSTN